MCDCFYLQNLITNESKTNLTASILKQAPNKQKVKRNADFNMKTRVLLRFIYSNEVSHNWPINIKSVTHIF